MEPKKTRKVAHGIIGRAAFISENEGKGKLSWGRLNIWGEGKAEA